MSAEGDFYTVDEIRYFSRYVTKSLQEKYNLTIDCLDLPSNIILRTEKELEDQASVSKIECDLYAKLYKYKKDQYELIYLPNNRITQIPSRFRKEVDCYEVENKMHYNICDFILKLGEKAFERDVKLGAFKPATKNVIIFKACHFARLYFTVDIYEEGKNFYKNYYIATACLYLASKMNDRQSIRDPLDRLADKHLQLQRSPEALPDSNDTAEACVEILRAEQNVLATIGFQLEFESPYANALTLTQKVQRASFLYRREKGIVIDCSQEETEQIKTKTFFQLFNKFLIFALVNTRLTICTSTENICKIVGLLTLSRLNILPSNSTSFDGANVADHEFIGNLVDFLDLPFTVKTFDLALHVCRVFNVKPASEFRQEILKVFKVIIDNRKDLWQHKLSNCRKVLLSSESRDGYFKYRETESPISMTKPSPLSSIDPSSPYIYASVKHSPAEIRSGRKRKREPESHADSLSALLNCEEQPGDDQKSFENASDGGLSNNTQIHSSIKDGRNTESVVDKTPFQDANITTPLIESIGNSEMEDEEIDLNTKKPRTKVEQVENKKLAMRLDSSKEQIGMTLDISSSCPSNCHSSKGIEIENSCGVPSIDRYDQLSSTTSPSTTNSTSIGSPENESSSPFKSNSSLETCTVDPGIVMNVP